MLVGLLTLVLLVSSFSATIKYIWSILFDRFRACQPMSVYVRQFDAALARVDTSSTGTQTEDEVWVAVLSIDQQIRIYPRDPDFGQHGNWLPKRKGVSVVWDQNCFGAPPWRHVEAPVVGRLRPSNVPGRKIMVLDSLRCLLRKEDQDDTCDGRQFNEALSVGVDALLPIICRHKHPAT
jgi:hypothetical protein